MKKDGSQVEVTLPSSQTERLECLRDLGRTMQGGSILVLGRRRLYPVRPEEEQDATSLRAQDLMIHTL